MIIAKGMPMEWHERLTVQQVLECLGFALPMAIVQLNGKPVSRKAWTATMVPDGAVVDVQMIVAGG